MTRYDRPEEAVTNLQREMLEWYYEHPHASIRETAEALNLSPGAVSMRVTSMRIQGLLVSKENTARSIRLTPKGWSLLGKQPQCPHCHQPLPKENA